MRKLRADEIECRVATIPGYNGKYLVTADGSIINTVKGIVMTPKPSNRGYVYVKLYGSDGIETRRVHRLVAEAFIPNPQGKDQVNHKDGIKDNNKVENLEWVTQKENNLHAIRNGLNSTEAAVNAQKIRVKQKALDGTLIRVWDCMSDASRATGIPVSNISHNCSGRIRHAGGYLWEKCLDC